MSTGGHQILNLVIFLSARVRPCHTQVVDSLKRLHPVFCYLGFVSHLKSALMDLSTLLIVAHPVAVLIQTNVSSFRPRLIDEKRRIRLILVCFVSIDAL